MFGKKTSIAITGMAGVGKTVLCDHITGKVHKRDYIHPRQSQLVEKGKVRAKRKRIELTVVPGQESITRSVALDGLFSSDQPVHGVVHVVGNGLATKRNQHAIDTLIERGVTTLAKLREYQLKEERRDLQQTCEQIVRSHMRHHQPSWMLVVVDKADLFQDSMESVRRYYSDSPDSKFARILNRLRRRVGTEFFRWESIPVCATLERYEWNGEVLHPQIDSAARDLYLAQFADALRSYCP